MDDATRLILELAAALAPGKSSPAGTAKPSSGTRASAGRRVSVRLAVDWTAATGLRLAAAGAAPSGAGSTPPAGTPPWYSFLCELEEDGNLLGGPLDAWELHFCEACSNLWAQGQRPVTLCPACGSLKVQRGLKRGAR